MEQELLCTLCSDIFRDPVILRCSHSFCRVCLQDEWKPTGKRLCPLCRRRHSMEYLPPNLLLRLLSDSHHRERLRRARPESSCRLHSEKLRLFCLDHHEPACLVCRDSEKHAGHTFRPVDEAARDHRRNLQEHLKSLAGRLQSLKEARAKFDETKEYVEAQARRVEGQIRGQFQRLRQFLVDEEEARLAALKEEEEQKKRTLTEATEPLSKAIDALSEAIRATEVELEAEDLTFLLSYKEAVERVQCCPLVAEPALPSQALIDVAEHLGNLSCSVWSNMKDVASYSPLVLDPNTAHPDLVLSDDLRSLAKGSRRPVPENPERIADSCVLGSQGWSSGVRRWDVEVGDNAEWKLGVLAESVRQKAYVLPGLWIIALHNGGYRALTPSHSYTPFSVETRPRRIRVTLDFTQGELTFWDLDTNGHIYTLADKFTEKMFPFVHTESEIPLKVLPFYINVIMEPWIH